MGASTKDTESAQALFCALADFISAKKFEDILNLEKYPTFWHFTGYTDNIAKKGYNDTLKESYAIEKKNNKETIPFKEWVEGYTSPELMELINTQRNKKLSISKKDWKNNNKYLKESDKHTIVNASGLPKMKQILDEEVDWYVSSVKIAKKLLQDLTTIDPDFDIKGGGCQMAYYRGEKLNPIMGTIGELFKKANTPKVLGDINKWSPADIYFATEGKPDAALELLISMNERYGEELDFLTLNDMILKLINAGKLLPLSLKKVKDDVHLVKVNFHKSTKQAILNSVKYDGVFQPVGLKEGTRFTMMPFKIDSQQIYTTTGKDGFKWKVPSDGNGPIYPRSAKIGDKNIAYRDIYVNFTTTERYVGDPKKHKQEVSFQFRHSPAAAGKPIKTLKCLLHYEGLNAISAGQVTSIEGLCDLIREGEGKGGRFGDELLKTYLDGYKKFEKIAKLYLTAQGTRLYNDKYPEYMDDYLKQSNKKKVYWGKFESGVNYRTKDDTDKDTGLMKVGLTAKQQKTIFNEDMGAISGITLMNSFRTTLDNYFNTKGNDAAEAKKRNVLMKIYQYTSSRHEHSARFVIAK